MTSDFLLLCGQSECILGTGKIFTAALSVFAYESLESTEALNSKSASLTIFIA